MIELTETQKMRNLMNVVEDLTTKPAKMSSLHAELYAEQSVDFSSEELISYANTVAKNIVDEFKIHRTKDEIAGGGIPRTFGIEAGGMIELKNNFIVPAGPGGFLKHDYAVFIQVGTRTKLLQKIYDRFFNEMFEFTGGRKVVHTSDGRRFSINDMYGRSWGGVGLLKLQSL